jgi:Family of unknown function (DUF5946)
MAGYTFARDEDTGGLPRVRRATPERGGRGRSYAGSSASCWALFGQVRPAQYAEPEANGQLAVDAYMAQHPGYATAAGRRSVLVHLVGLCLAIEHSMPAGFVTPALGRVLPGKPDVPALLPVPASYGVTVAFAHEATGPDDRRACVERWARDVWRSWGAHREHVLGVLRESGLERELTESRTSSGPRPPGSRRRSTR